MPRAVADQFNINVPAASLYIQGIADPEERIRKPRAHADTFIAFLKHENTTKTDRDNCMAMVVNDARLELDDRRRLLEAIADSQKARQGCHTWGHNILNIVTATDWGSWKTKGAAHADDIIDAMIVRIQNPGGKNISEPDKKLVTAAWLQICGLGETAQHRAVLKQRFNTRFDHVMRGFRPKVYTKKAAPHGGGGSAPSGPV